MPNPLKSSDFNTFTEKAKRKLRRMVNPPSTTRNDREPHLYRKSTTQDDKTTTNVGQLGPAPLKDAFLATKLEISLKHLPTKKHNLTRKERIALKKLATNHDLVSTRPSLLWSETQLTTSKRD